MKSLRILFSVMFVMSLATACDDGDKKTTKSEICNDNIDNDGDGRVDCFDSDCASDPACATNNVNNTNNTNNTNNVTNPETNCVDGIDNDGDGQTDCNDSDCATDAACQTASCTMDSIFFDSPQTCAAGFICGINQTMQPECLPEAGFAGGTFYGACGGSGECPKGSGCFDMEGGTCLPYCSDTHTTCPAGGACVYGVQGNDDLFLCGPTDDCNVIDGSGCETAGEGCYIASDDGSGLCVTAGTGATGSTCSALNQCLPGHLCGDLGQGNVCIKLCAGAEDCTAGTCQSIGQNGLPAGIGICM
jgi:hypothetical protein